MTPEELRLVRRNANLTQAQLAARLNKSRITITNWERGLYQMPPELLSTLANAGLSVALVDDAAARAQETKHKVARAAADNYARLRNAPFNCSHADVIKTWHSAGFTPSYDAQQLIVAEWPDITDGSTK